MFQARLKNGEIGGCRILRHDARFAAALRCRKHKAAELLNHTEVYLRKENRIALGKQFQQLVDTPPVCDDGVETVLVPLLGHIVEILDEVALRLLVLLRLCRLDIGIKGSIVILALANAAHLVGIDARLLIFGRFALNNAVFVALGFIGRTPVCSRAGCARLVPDGSGNDAVDIFTHTLRLALACNIDGIGLYIEIPFITILRLAEFHRHAGIGHCLLHRCNYL